MSMVTMNGHRKMTKALNKLNKAVEEKKSEIEESLEEFKKSAQEKLEETKETIVETAENVDNEVHTHPWAYIGGAAALALLTGFIVGRVTKR